MCCSARAAKSFVRNEYPIDRGSKQGFGDAEIAYRSVVVVVVPEIEREAVRLNVVETVQFWKTHRSSHRAALARVADITMARTVAGAAHAMCAAAVRLTSGPGGSRHTLLLLLVGRGRLREVADLFRHLCGAPA